jgi:signal transduction histidine kinase
MRRFGRTGAVGWPLVVLLVGVAAVALIGVEVSRSIRTNTQVAERARYGYSKFALWSYREHLAERMRGAAREVLGAVNHGQQQHMSPNIPPAGELGHYLPFEPACGCHRTEFGPLPMVFYGTTVGSDTMGVGPNFYEDPSRGWLADPSPIFLPHGHGGRLPDEEGRWLAGVLTAQARSEPSPWGYRWLVATWQGEPRFFVTTLMPMSIGDTVVYAAEYPALAMDSLFNAVLDDPGLLPLTAQSAEEELRGGHRNVLSLQVSTPEGVPVISWGVPEAWREEPARMPPAYGGFLLQLEIIPEMVNRIVIGGLPQTRTPVLLGLLVVALGLTGVAGMLMQREVRFARARTDFVASVSHELRTPLAQVRLALDAMARRDDTDATLRTRGMQIIDREVLRLQHLVDGVLQFRRGRGFEPQAPLESLDVATEVRALVDEFRPLAAGKSSTVRLDTHGEAPARLESGALRHILINLLENAAKYGAPHQEIVVTVRSSERDVVLTVDDRGEGVPMAERARIWKPYMRGSAAATRGTSGSGIGLAVVQDVVTRHGGAVMIGDAPGGGARFTVTLPRGGS